MFTFNSRDAHRQLTPARVHLPFQKPIGDILPEKTKTEDDDADPALLRLPAPALRGTWARAYALLTRLVAQVGWDELLKTRSTVFVMEEEYRMQKAQVETRAISGTDDVKGPKVVIHEDGQAVRKSSDDDDASTRGMMSASSTDFRTSVTDKHPSDEPAGVPTIKVSTDDSETRTEDGTQETGETVATRKSVETAETAVNNIQVDPVERPPQSAVGEEEKPLEAHSLTDKEPFSFSNKRLCERWLDNLFMVLYEVSLIFVSAYKQVERSTFFFFVTTGPPRVDYFPRRSRSLQDPACRISQNGPGVGDPGGTWLAVAP